MVDEPVAAEKSEPVAKSQQQFALQRIYVRDLSFESPGVPDIFRSDWKPEVNLELNSKNKRLDEDHFEIVLAITVTVKSEAKVAYIVEIQQAGLFLIKGMPKEQLPHLIGSYCPGILFPYAREAISDVIGKGGFPQMLLAPVNFDALFAEAVKKNQAQH